MDDAAADQHQLAQQSLTGNWQKELTWGGGHGGNGGRGEGKVGGGGGSAPPDVEEEKTAAMKRGMSRPQSH